MEIRAPYALIGLFVLVAIGAVFGFVYWMHNAGGLEARTVYQVRFVNTVSGLLPGAAGFFHRIPLGEGAEMQPHPGKSPPNTATGGGAATTPARTGPHT